MRAFAVPSYYDGQIRLNLRGRERDGLVEPSRYEATCREIEALLRECRNPLTGERAHSHWTFTGVRAGERLRPRGRSLR
jgi:predicted AlkP superfamily phosphohydrolase/phosphomutase